MLARKLPALVLSSLSFLVACGPEMTSVSESAGAAQASAADRSLAGGNKRVTVMSRNLYLGGDLVRAARATTPEEFVGAVTAIWLMVEKNQFRVRAEALADEIASTRPALVGLQEVFTWRKDSPADGAATPAEQVELDFLAILLDALGERGLAYRAVASVELIDIEAPTALGFDVRATDHDVILASDLVAETAVVAETVYDAKIPFPTPVGLVPVKRGFVAVDAKVRGETIRFVNTHLEAFDVPPPLPPGLFRILQAQQLAAFLGDDPRHTVLAAAGFQDLWATLRPGEDGFTSGFPEDLSQDGVLDERIDYVLYRGLFDPLAVDVVGETAADKAVTGLWPSDHAGVVGTLRIGDPRFAGR